MSNTESQKQIIPKIILTREKIEGAKIKKISLTPEKIFAPTIVDFPPNEYKTGRPLIVFKGRAHPGDNLQLKARDQEILGATVDIDGLFIFSVVRLFNKTNTITIINPSLEKRGVSDSRVSVTVYYDNSFAPFSNLRDPITKYQLGTVDISEVVCCRTCGSYQLRESWLSVGSKCMLCHGDQYRDAQDEEFWQPK